MQEKYLLWPSNEALESTIVLDVVYTNMHKNNLLIGMILHYLNKMILF